MIHEFAHVVRPTRLRTVVLALLGVMIGAACDNSTDPLGTSEPTDPPEVAATADSSTLVGSLVPAFATISYTGLPFGPFNLWDSYTTVAWGPAPFTGSGNFTAPAGIVAQIGAARSKHQRLLLAMTGGSSTQYTTNGKFDMVKWKNRINQFKTTTIQNAVAGGVADGTIVGNSLLDEPETKRWGGVLTKPMLDQMAAYVKASFPTLPVGVNFGPTGYQWRTYEHYKVVDYSANQYNWWITQGNAAAWRDKVLAQARLDGVAVAFSLNILDGGVQDRTGTYDCSGTGGKGTYFPNCRMTPTQVRDYGRAIGPSGCSLLLWKYDYKFLSVSANLTAIKDLASTMSSIARRSCKRP
jgi:hypothetical protein